MKVLKGLQSCVILDKCVEFKVYSENNNIVLDFYYSCGVSKTRDVIRKYYPLSSTEVELLSKKRIEIDYICNHIKDKLCTWLSDDNIVYFDLKHCAQSIINEYLQR